MQIKFSKSIGWAFQLESVQFISFKIDASKYIKKLINRKL